MVASVTTPEIEDIEYEYGSEEVQIEYAGFESADADACDYVWSYTAMLSD